MRRLTTVRYGQQNLRGFAHQQLGVLGLVLAFETRGKVHGISEHGVLHLVGRTDIAHDHIAGV